MLALDIFMSCSERRLFEGASESASDRADDILCLSSAAAALVKVTMSIFEMSAGESSFVSERIMRSVSVAVFPEPAAAETRRSFPCVSIAVVCAGVKDIFFSAIVYPFSPSE